MPPIWILLLSAGPALSSTLGATQTSDPQSSAARIPGDDLHELDRCKPRRIGEASECMRRALGEKTAAEINTPAGEKYRAAFADLITMKWNLANPDSPVARDLRGLHVYDSGDAAYVLLADMAARVGHYKLDYEKFARERARQKPDTVVPAPARQAETIQPGPLPLERCRNPSDGADIRIVTCTLNPDRTISRTTSGRSGTALPLDAVAVPLETCAKMGAVPAGSRLKACFKLPDGRLLRQTARPAAPSED